MLTSKEKRKENIAEYLLYMWQIEDIIRAYNLDIEKITLNVIDKYKLDDEKRKEYIDWYESLIMMMRSEGVINSGHLQINTNIIIQLSSLHSELLKSPEFPEYSVEFYKTLPFIVEIRSKAGEHKSGELETCFNALYGILLLRLQGKDISPDTAIAMKQVAKFIAMLASYFKKDEKKPLFGNKED